MHVMTSFVTPQEFIKAAGHTAHHFGFVPLEKLKQDPKCKNCDQKVVHRAAAADRRNDALHGLLTAGMCSFFDFKLNALGGPTLFYSIEQVPRTGELALTLHVFNVKKSIAEAVLIQTIRSLLTDLGYPEHVVRVNSLGDADSVSRYIRELTNYMKKRIDDMPAAARELMKEHALVALMHLIDKRHELADKSPNPLEYLTDGSRKHFREIVEFLDMSGTPFEIDPKLIGHHECYSDALFAFDLLNESYEKLPEEPLYVRGGRYSAFVSKMSKQKMPAAGAVIVLRNKKAPVTVSIPKVTYNAAVFMVQLGFGPKIRSLLLIDELKRAGISVYQNVMSDSLSEQLQQAVARNVQFAVIVGQKEYVENKVILRNLRQQTQEFIPSHVLPDYLKRVIGV